MPPRTKRPKKTRWRKPPARPRIGPVRDPLRLWFLEFEARGQVWRKYFGYRHEARTALRTMKAGKQHGDSGSTGD